MRTVRHQPQDRLQTSGALRRNRFGGLAAAQPPAAQLAAAHRQRADEAVRHSFSRTRLGKENYLPTPTPSPPPRRANRSSGQSPPAPTTRATHRSPPTPPTVPPTPPKPTLRLATCQPKHRTLPEKILKTLLLDPERSGCRHPLLPTPRCLPPNGKQSLDSRPKSPFPSQPFPTPSPQHYPSPPPSQNRLIYG